MTPQSNMQCSGFDAKLPQTLPCSKVAMRSTNSSPNSFRHRKDLRQLYFGERRTRIRRILCTELEAVELHLRLSCYLGSTSRKAEGSGLFTHVYAEDSNENSATMLVSWAGCAGLAELEDWPCAPRPQRSLLYILTLTSPSLPYSLTLCGRKVWIRPLSLRCGERLRTAA